MADSISDLMLALAQNAQGASAVSELNASSGNVANAAAVATLPVVAGKTNFLTGFEVVATGATAALTVLVTVTGLVGGTLTYPFVFPAGAGVAAQPLVVNFPRPLQASGAGVAIAVTLPASGAGGLNASVNAHGFVR